MKVYERKHLRKRVLWKHPIRITVVAFELHSKVPLWKRYYYIKDDICLSVFLTKASNIKFKIFR